MSKIDWHAYLDGSLSPEQTQEAEQILRGSPEARRRLENLKTFISEVRRQGLTQEVPLARLHRSIPSSRRFAWPRLVGPAFAAAAVIGFTYYLANRDPDPIEVRADGPGLTKAEGISMASFSQGASWIKEKNGIVTKPISLVSAQLVGCERTPQGGCYCVKVDGQIVHLSFNKRLTSSESLVPKDIDGKQFLVGKSMTCFSACGVMWTCSGGTDEARWKVAQEAAAQLL
jgi:hypothetical protein